MLNDWHELGNQQFRKWVQYEIDWKVPGLANPLELEYFLLFGSIYGGPIALIADPRKLTNIPEPLHSKILIFTSAGKKLSEINWQEGQILSMSWNGVENLVVVNTSGFVRLYDLYGTSVYSFSLLTEEKRNDPSISLTEVHFWLDGLAAMTSRSDVRVAEVILPIIYIIIYLLFFVFSHKSKYFSSYRVSLPFVVLIQMSAFILSCLLNNQRELLQR